MESSAWTVTVLIRFRYHTFETISDTEFTVAIKSFNPIIRFQMNGTPVGNLSGFRGNGVAENKNGANAS